MTETPPRPDRRPQPGGIARRGVLRALPGLGVAGWAGAARAEPPAVLVAGPDGGRLERWSRVVVPAVSRFLPTGSAVRITTAGGVDGVTGANQFDARTSPDGGTALLIPGAAALAWLAGDPRARFDAAGWLPVMTGLGSGVLVARAGPGRSTLAPGGRLRIAAAGPSGPEMAALLGVELLGAEPVPVFGLADPEAVRLAFARAEIDLVFLCGSRVPERLAALATLGGRALATLGAADGNGAATRDPSFPEVPTLAELPTVRTRDRLFEAFPAVAWAARLDFGLVLPQLAPAGMVSLWRRACVQAAATPELHAAAAAAGLQVQAGLGATGTNAILPGADALLALRRWLGTRFNWSPG